MPELAIWSRSRSPPQAADLIFGGRWMQGRHGGRPLGCVGVKTNGKVRAKGARVTGPVGPTLADDALSSTAEGESIRELAEKNGRLLHFVHRLPRWRTTSRCCGRGGATRGKARSSSKA